MSAAAPVDPVSNAIGGVAFAPLWLLLSPIVFVGYATLYASTRKRYGTLRLSDVSAAMTRAELHRARVREDPVTERLLAAMPWVPAASRVAALSYLPLCRLYTWHATSLEPVDLLVAGVGDLEAMRTLFVDRHVYGNLHPQIVFLQPGLDSRPWLVEGRACFEVDHPENQFAKVSALTAAGMDANALEYVAGSIESLDWMAALVDKGLSLHVPTLFILEGLSYKLSPAALDHIVHLVSRCCAGSTLVMDFLVDEVVSGQWSWWVPLRMRAFGEPFTQGIGSMHDKEPAATWAEERALTLRDWAPGGVPGRCWGGVMAVDVMPE